MLLTQPALKWMPWQLKFKSDACITKRKANCQSSHYNYSGVSVMLVQTNLLGCQSYQSIIHTRTDGRLYELGLYKYAVQYSNNVKIVLTMHFSKHISVIRGTWLIKIKVYSLSFLELSVSHFPSWESISMKNSSLDQYKDKYQKSEI